MDQHVLCFPEKLYYEQLLLFMNNRTHTKISCGTRASRSRPAQRYFTFREIAVVSGRATVHIIYPQHLSRYIYNKIYTIINSQSFSSLP